MEENKKTNKSAIYSIVCSIISFFIFGWLGISGVLFGIRSLNEIKQNNEKGIALAYIGIIIGGISFILYIMSLLKMF